MDIEDIIQKIVDNGRVEDMQELSDILEDTIETLQEYYPEEYRKYEKKLYEMAYGCVLNREIATEIVRKMRPYGEKWAIEETSEIQRNYGLSFRDYDFYVVINSAYNDYNDIFGEDIDKYVRFAIDFINDEDAKQDKVYIYYTTIPE